MCVVSIAPDIRENEPVEALLAKFARALVLFRSLMICAVGPVRVMLAALFTMLAPSKPSVPLAIYFPPVRVLPEKLVNPPPVTYIALPLLTWRVPVLVNVPAPTPMLREFFWLAKMVP